MTSDEEQMMYGTLEQREGGGWQLRFTRTLRHPVEKVWRAIIEPQHLAQWFPSTIEGERAAGAPLTFAFPGGVVDPIEGEMLVYEPPSRLELRWGTDVLRIELRPVDGGTELTLVDVLDDVGKGVRDAAGWHTCLDALEENLSGSPTAREQLDRWAEIQPHYAERFPPQAAVIGPPSTDEPPRR